MDNLVIALLTVVHIIAIITIAIVAFTLPTIEAIPVLVGLFCVVMLITYVVGRNR